MFRIAFRHVRAFPLSSFYQSRPFHATPRALSNEKLKILFCGADQFSVAHLDALHAEIESPDSTIESIQVVTRTDKRTGRGLKQLTSPPVKAEADKLGLHVYQLDTFTGWNPPPTDLVVAVSFGRLVPARILNASKYGGINVHPSLLPDLRGAAPIHWAIMLGRKHTGVTVQTLHPTKFDEGVILDQTPPPGIPINGKWGGLNDVLAGYGAVMLVNAIRNRLFIPPYKALPQRDFDEVALAPKIASEHRQLDFNALTSADILRRKDALYRLWAYAQDVHGDRLRIHVAHTMSLLADNNAEIAAICKWQPIGQPFAIEDTEGNVVENGSILVNTIDGKTLKIPRMTVEGMPDLTSIVAARRARLIAPFRQQHGFHKYRVGWFYSPLATGPADGSAG